MSISDAISRGLADRDGAAGVEFALLLPTLVLLLIGTIDMGGLAYQSMQASAAAHAGALYAIRNGWNATAVASAVTNATSLTVTATPAPQQFKACVVSGAVQSTTAQTCTGGATPGTYVQVNAQAAVTPIVVWSSFAMPSTVSAQAVVRIQ